MDEFDEIIASQRKVVNDVTIDILEYIIDEIKDRDNVHQIKGFIHSYLDAVKKTRDEL
jgi:hypothetical protein